MINCFSYGVKRESKLVAGHIKSAKCNFCRLNERFNALLLNQKKNWLIAGRANLSMESSRACMLIDIKFDLIGLSAAELNELSHSRSPSAVLVEMSNVINDRE